MPKRPLLTAGLTAAILCFATLPATAIAGDDPPELIKTSVSIRYDGNGVFVGSVKAKGGTTCRLDRKVVLYRKGVNINKKVAFDNTVRRDGSRLWAWKISVVRSGDYYAKAPATAKCAEGVSRTVTYKRPTS